MRKTLIGNNPVRVPCYTYGTASLHHFSKKRQYKLLELAAKHGFTHFDTSPLYGFGNAEKVIGEVFKGDSSITVSTKVGLYPPGGANQTRCSSLLRKVSGKVFPVLSRAIINYSVSTIERNFEESLKRLQKNKVEFLFIHEPELTTGVKDELFEWFNKNKRLGYIMNSGVAGDFNRIAASLTSQDCQHQVVQTSMNQLMDVINFSGTQPEFTYGYHSGRANKTTKAQFKIFETSVEGSSKIVFTKSEDRMIEYQRYSKANN